MLVEDKLLAEGAIHQPDQEEDVGRIRSMNHVKAMADQHLNAQHERHEQGHAVFKDVGTVFVAAFRKVIAVDVDALKAFVRLAIPSAPLWANNAHLKATIAE